MAMQQFAVVTARPLPVIILADVSGSMTQDNNIGALNAALKDFLNTLSQESRLNAEIQVSIITFGGLKAEVHVPLTPAWQINQTNDLVASGGTPMGGAFELAVEMIENKDIIPSRAYKPTIVLISDGIPTDNWEASFDKLKNSDRAQKASRMAMAIGTGADKNMLKAFVNDLEASEVFEAHNAKEIHRFFRAVSMSVSSRSQSNTPNQLPTVDFSKLPDDELDLSDF
ncbi:vWA domain-containing protein [Acinetobacter sp. TR3]|uniref:vWA domain-containing protein n=1 Tax=Acinetobacter sp. TR3 TaxID=3003392 RepID=UPI0022AC0745|nr:VWA domain-containing protein [Acinetobacter sp. TR3]WAU77571.1 VWA domain-containing protein [Acinetobacter sp. TR3]